MQGIATDRCPVLGDTLLAYVLELGQESRLPAFAHLGPYRRTRWNRGEVLGAAIEVALWLQRVGVEPGDRVVLQGANSPAWVAAFYGCVLRGAVAVPLEPGLAPTVAAGLAERTRPRAGLGDAGSFPLDGLPWRCLRDVVPAPLPAAGGTGAHREHAKSSGTPEVLYSGATEKGETETPGSLKTGATQGDAQETVAGDASGADGPATEVLRPGATGMDLLQQAGLAVPDSQPGDPVQIVFTSGTTGRPRAVPITHRNLLAAIHPIERGYRKKRRQQLVSFLRPRLLCLVPASHLFGQVVGIHLPALMGLPVVFPEDLRPRAIREVIKREKITVAVAVPRMLALLQQDLIREGVAPLDGDRRATSKKGAETAAGQLEGDIVTAETKSLEEAQERNGHRDSEIPQETETSRESTSPQTQGNPWLGWLRKAWRGRRVRRHLGWRFAAWISGGAALDEEVEEFWDRLGYFVVQGYGLTETAPIISVSNPFARRRGSVGRPLSGQEVRVGPGGELWVRGENVASGYLDDPEASAESFQDGWLRTGDRVERDEKGRLYVRGRLKDVIVTADGTNVDPAVIEKALEATPGIAEAACVGRPGPRGEEIHVVLVPSSNLGPEESSAGMVAGDANEQAGAMGGPEVPGASERREVLGATRVPAESGQGQAAGNTAEQIDPMGIPRDSGATAPSIETGSALPLVEAAVRAANERLPAGQRIQSHTVWHEPALPRTSLGKLKRAAIRERLAHEGRTTDTAGRGRPADPVAEALARLTGRKPGALDGEIDLDRDLGLSSLDRLDLMVKLEETTGRTLDEPAVAGARTLTDLRQAMERPPSTPIPMPRWARGRSASLVRSAGRTLLVAPIFHSLFRLRVEGREKIEGMEPPFLLVANHLSHLDTAAILLALPRRLRRHVAVAMATEHFSSLFRDDPGKAGAAGPGTGGGQGVRVNREGHSRRGGRLGQRLAYGSAVTLFHAYPLPRGGGFSGTLAYTAELVEAGYCPLIFPEGRLERPEETPPPFREGPALLAVKLGLPVIPIGIDGSGERLPPGARIPRPGRIQVRFGMPLQALEQEWQEEESGGDDRITRLTTRLEETVRALCGATASRRNE